MAQIDSAILRFLINACWQICLIIGAGALADRLLRRSPARFRYLLWAAVVSLCVIVPALPHGTLPAVTNRTETFRFVLDASGVFASETARTAAGWLTAAYAVFLLVCAARLIAGLRRVNIWLGNAEPLEQEVLLSDAVPTPVTFGFANPVILLPRSFAESAGAAMIEAVLAHERAHIARNDFAWNLFLLLIAMWIPV